MLQAACVKVQNNERCPIMRSFAILIALSLPAAAQQVDCANAITQLDLNTCAARDWEEADARLNEVYAETVAILQEADANYPISGDSEEDRLRAAQRAWIAYRDANCDSAGYPMRGGSAEPLLTYGCLRRMTEERITELQALTETF
jgi:uncharacterized protein YecT (DUF1311 family)